MTDIDWDHVVLEGRVHPATSTDSEYFWAGLREHVLLIQQCGSCAALRHPATPMCPSCGSLEWAPTASAGRGVVHSYTVVHAPFAPGFTQPSVVALIALDEGVRMIANVVGSAPSDLAIGMPVEVFFADQAEGWTVPQFRRRAA